MWSAFKLSRPQISIFHSPSSPPSTAALTLLKSALSSPYPPTTTTKSQPLTFDLEIIENKPPTPDQLRTISSYLSSTSPSPVSPGFFLSSHPSVDSDAESKPTSVGEVSKLVEKNVKALKWPIVVDWTGGRAAVGDVEGVKRILEELRKEERGEKE